MATTLKDIADRLNVSVVTVSKVLNETGNISEDTRNRVLEVAKELRYRPNTLARSMRTGKTGIIGMVYSSQGMGQGLSWDLLKGIQSLLAKKSYNLMLGELPSHQLGQPGHISSLLNEWTADGLLIFNQLNLPDHISDLIDEQHVPVVWINSKQPENAVYFDDFNGARAAVFHLADLGHRRIAYCDHSHPVYTTENPEHYSQPERHNGYLSAMLELGLEPDVKMPEAYVEYIDRPGLWEAWLSGPTRPTAVVSYGGSAAAYSAANSLGLKIPRDLSIIFFSPETAPIEKIHPAVLHLKYDQIGSVATRMLFDRLADKGKSRPSVAVPLPLIPGGSCGPVDG